MELSFPSPSLLSEINHGCCSNQVDEKEEEEGNLEISTVNSISNCSNQTLQMSPSNSVTSPSHPNPNRISKSIDCSRRIVQKNKKVLREVSGSTASSSQQKGLRITTKRRHQKVFVGFGGRNSETDLDALALPLGMSFAAVVAQVLDKKTIADERVPADHLSKICTSALKESLANVYGNRFDCFLRNFEKSFESTLRTLRMIDTAFLKKGGEPLSNSRMEDYSPEVAQPTLSDKQGNFLSNSSVRNHHSDAAPSTCGAQERSCSSVEEIKEELSNDSTNQELILHQRINQQLSCVSRSPLDSHCSNINQSMLSTFEKSVEEQARSNDLKSFEIRLMMKRMQLKESQLNLSSDLNRLEKFKLSMGISKATFKAEKFKTQLEDTRHAELVKKCIDCLVAGLFIMSACLIYGAYVFSYQRLTEVTASCMSPPKESTSWWMPKRVASINSGLHSLRCQVEVLSRMMFGIFMILAIAYLLLQRSSSSKQTMPITIILLLLGGACGFIGKLCVDTLGGNSYLWLSYWELLCMVHFFSNVCTSSLFILLHGPVPVSQGIKANTKLPYWSRRFMFYTAILLIPILCGLMPFAGPRDWKHHFVSLVSNRLFGSEVQE